MAAATLDLDDIQGIVIRGYGALGGAAFVLLRVGDPPAAKRWLAEIAETVTSARVRPTVEAVNLAFTYAGLATLGIGNEALGFAPEFVEGMATPHRSRILGDDGPSAPDGWAWGGPANAAVHVALLLYARDDAAATALHERARRAYTGAGLVEVAVLTTHLLPMPGGVKEHFGFRDGIGQPSIAADHRAAGFVPAGVLAPDRAENTVAAGEFVFGHPNEYGQHPLAPVVPHDPTGILPSRAAGRPGFDLGRNGTYLVVRQLAQHVAAFWQFVREAAGADEAAVRLASKMMGRWPSGTPLVMSPGGDRADLQTSDAFGYATLDPDGFACPFGAHARRANPRDGLFPGDPSESIRESKRHRLIRRGRAYGPPLDPSLDPVTMMRTPDDGRERGLNFLCFNADIERQFEFVQHTWLGDPKFRGLWDDPDPLLGGRLPSERAFVEQAEPVRRRWTGLPPFVRVRGGGYFFMPGIRALRYLARLP